MKVRYKHYLLGFVAGIDYADGSEWLYAESDLASTWSNAPKKQQVKVYKTREEAKDAAQRKSDLLNFPKFTRGYVFETVRDLPSYLLYEASKHGKVYLKK